MPSVCALKLQFLQRPREQKESRESTFDADSRLASARKRLQENYKREENGLCFHFINNDFVIKCLHMFRLILLVLIRGFVLFCVCVWICEAKRQRTIQVMDIHEIPKPKNAFFGKNKGGSSQGRHW